MQLVSTDPGSWDLVSLDPDSVSVDHFVERWPPVEPPAFHQLVATDPEFGPGFLDLVLARRFVDR